MTEQAAKNVIKWVVRWALFWSLLIGLLIVAGVVWAQALEANS